MSPIKLITFDLDDTLWAVKPSLIRAEEQQNAWLREHRPRALDSMTPDQLVQFKKSVWRTLPDHAHNMSKLRQQFLYELQTASGYSHQEATAGAAIAFGRFLEERHRVSLYDGALSVLELLSQRFRLGAITNGNADVYKTDAAPYFNFAVRAEEVGAAKPAAQPFLKALELGDCLAEETLHIGDHWEHDVLGARQAGLHTLWLNPLDQAWPHPSDAPMTIQSLSEIELAISTIR
jgi:FMN hydrolase / 5-amino-6-(5-phospho-D-ribitylamino)uracil phosphatase